MNAYHSGHVLPFLRTLANGLRKMKSIKVTKSHCGIYFDLRPMFLDLNRRFFDEKIEACLRWGLRKNHKKIKKSIRLGSYHHHSKTIILHPCLDQAIVPFFCVERILFHEMLHQHYPAKKTKNGKNLVHHREFNLFEKRYPYLAEADLWLKANLERLLKF